MAHNCEDQNVEWVLSRIPVGMAERCRTQRTIHFNDGKSHTNIVQILLALIKNGMRRKGEQSGDKKKCQCNNKFLLTEKKKMVLEPFQWDAAWLADGTG